MFFLCVQPLFLSADQGFAVCLCDSQRKNTHLKIAGTVVLGEREFAENKLINLSTYLC